MTRTGWSAVRRVPVWGAAILILMMLLNSAVYAEWGGGISATAADVRSDSIHTQVLDQTYNLRVSGSLISRLYCLGTMRYRLLHSETDDSLSLRQTEMMPALFATWTTHTYSMRSSYEYREIRDDRDLTSFTGRSAMVYGQTNVPRLPSLRGRYEWAKNVNDLELLGRDTRYRLAAAGVRYDIHRTSISYDFQDNRTVNENTGLRFGTQEHVGRFDNYLQLADKLVAIQTDYQFIDRKVRESRAGGPTMVSVPALAGLYAVDPTPDFGGLLSLPSLIDGNDSLPASPGIDLSGPDAHNFGLYFGAPVSVDHLFLSTDTLANADMRWAVFLSDDSVTWQMVQNYAPGHFDRFFNRFEIAFPVQTTRFIKLVNEPLLQSTHVYPTELRALLSRTDSDEPDHTTDHRGDVNLSVTPTTWLQFGAGVNIQRVKGSLTTLEREQDAYRGSVRLHPHPFADLSFGSYLGRIRRPESSQERMETEQHNAILQSHWLPTLTTRASASRSIERTDDLAIRRTDYLAMRAETRWLPGLAGSTEFGYIEGHYLQSGDLVITRLYGQSIDAQPTRTSDVRVEYRYYDMESRLGFVPSYRRVISGRAGWRVTPLLSLAAEGTFYAEPGRETSVTSGQASWNPTTKWLFSGNVARTESRDQTGTTLYGAQATFYWSYVTSISFDYSYVTYVHSIEPAVTTARLSLVTRF